MPTEVGRRHIPPAPELSKIRHPDPQVVLRMALERVEQWAREVADNFIGLPAPHAKTHKGGKDSVSGTTPPSPVTPGAAAAVGDPTIGFAPIDHVHDGTLLSALDELEDLAGTTTEALAGINVTYVHNPEANKLLEEILLELRRIERLQLERAR